MRALFFGLIGAWLSMLSWLPLHASAETLGPNPFSSDGCSRFPDGTHTQPSLWLDCCRTHDAAYWAGGTAQQRAMADAALQQCVNDKQQPSISAIMLMGVRVGGSPFIPTPFRWGYGWPLGRGYSPLTPAEQASVLARWPTDIPLPGYLSSTPVNE